MLSTKLSPYTSLEGTDLGSLTSGELHSQILCRDAASCKA